MDEDLQAEVERLRVLLAKTIHDNAIQYRWLQIQTLTGAVQGVALLVIVSGGNIESLREGIEQWAGTLVAVIGLGSSAFAWIMERKRSGTD